MSDQQYASTLERIDAAARAMGQQTAAWVGDIDPLDVATTTSGPRRRRGYLAPLVAAAAVAAVGVTAAVLLDRPSSRSHTQSAGSGAPSSDAPSQYPYAPEPVFDATGAAVASLLDAAGAREYRYAEQGGGVAVEGPSAAEYTTLGGYYPAGTTPDPGRLTRSADGTLAQVGPAGLGTVYLSVGRASATTSPCTVEATFAPTPAGAGACSLRTIDGEQFGVSHGRTGGPYTTLAIVHVRPDGVFVRIAVTDQVNFNPRAKPAPGKPWDWSDAQLAAVTLSPDIQACTKPYCGDHKLPAPSGHS